LFIIDEVRDIKRELQIRPIKGKQVQPIAGNLTSVNFTENVFSGILYQKPVKKFAEVEGTST